LHLDAALLERAHRGSRDLLVDAREDLRQHFEDRDLGTGVDEERRELTSDCTATDDATRGGTSARSSTWSEERTTWPSNSKPSIASARGVEPVAMMTLRRAPSIRRKP
jgi:hypothetical protein